MSTLASRHIARRTWTMSLFILSIDPFVHGLYAAVNRFPQVRRLATSATTWFLKWVPWPVIHTRGTPYRLCQSRISSAVTAAVGTAQDNSSQKWVASSFSTSRYCIPPKDSPRCR
ncbi:hypothetical protein PR003_g17059 [Phytophthora rubi]|uniref:Uncharacterized protein n=1 Tax=Phytophthora rubi TaxID=129364 RepID=A0A6A4ERB6_9STRA|nr:hypothetical protein PR003_g17059 [Phytophthora rubi]